MDVLELWTPYGKCFVLYFDWQMVERDVYTVYLDMSDHQEILVNLHERHNEIGLNWMVWPVPAATVMVQRGQSYAIRCKENTFTPRASGGVDGIPCTKKEGYSYPKCLTEWAQRAYLGMFMPNETACWYPSGFNLASGLGLPPCKTGVQERAARYKAYTLILERLTDQSRTGCPRRCRRVDTDVSVMMEPVPADVGEAETHLFLKVLLEVEHRKQVLLYDLNSIVSAVGGSLGLFLGFSCLSVFTFLWRKLSESPSICLPRKTKPTILVSKA